MDGVVRAIGTVPRDGYDLAYGQACQGIALLMRPVREWGEDVAKTPAHSVEDITDQLIEAVDEYDKCSHSRGRRCSMKGSRRPPEFVSSGRPGASQQRNQEPVHPLP